jgi:hypothetical protein
MAAHEMHRLGLANKPMIIALKANVAEIANTYQAAFPDDKILYASEKDFSPQTVWTSSTASRTTTMPACHVARPVRQDTAVDGYSAADPVR